MASHKRIEQCPVPATQQFLYQCVWACSVLSVNTYQRILAILQENDSKVDFQFVGASPSCLRDLCPNFMKTN